MRLRSILWLWPTASVLTACAAIHRPATTVPRLQQDAVVAASAERATRDSVIARLVRRTIARGDRTIDILMLSGGGQNGAFGAGFLRGWRERADSTMPTFDLITGISTGAIQAPYALLGTPAAMDTLTVLYREAQTRIAPSIDWWSIFHRTGGLVNTAKFDRALAASVDGQFRDELRRAFVLDRQIVIATSDFDLGVGRTWTLNDALDTSAESLVRTRRLLKAATAIPGIFPPVIIDGHVHADGGVITNVLPLLAFHDYERLAQALAAHGVRDVTVRVYVIMNLWAFAQPRVITPSSRRQISARSTAMLFYAHQPQTLELLDALAKAVTTGVPGMRMEFHAATQTPDWALEPGADALFDRGFMKRLDAWGYAKARSASPWDAVPSAYIRSGPVAK
jgi:predicted acylesterase/phospholipase RssA